MEQGKLTRHNRKGKHLTKEERVVMERMSRAGVDRPETSLRCFAWQAP